MMSNVEPLILRTDRKAALGSLTIIVFFVLISALLLFLGLQPGRPTVGWSLVLFGALGLAAFTASGIVVLRIMRAPWHLEIHPAHLILRTPAYDLTMLWEAIAGIAVDEVNRRPACILIFGDVAAVVESATFHARAQRPGAVTDAATMRTRMEENFAKSGYHLVIPRRLLEIEPDDLAGLLTKARTGQLWVE
jgi:hypothetical protein